jgi:NADH-quinone oxidoreductase subunit M
VELLIIAPIVLALVSALGSKWNKWITWIFSMVGFVILLGNWGSLAPLVKGAEFATLVDYPWLGETVHFQLGIDGISFFLLMLTNILIPVIVLSINSDKRLALIPLILFMQAGLNGVFMAQDGLLFYLFWELAMIPIYFITLMYSERDAFSTTIRFFVYTFIGSLAMLASLIFLGSKSLNGSFAYTDLYNVQLSFTESIWVGAGFLLAFAVKIPLFPFHVWQPNTYTYAPAQGSMLLSGIMLKMGLYGVLRWYFPMATESIDFYQPIIMTLAVIGVIYGAIIAIRQDDMKRLIAYSSISHVGLIAAGLFALNSSGFQGGLLQMFVHGVNVVGLFVAVNIIERNFGTRNLNELGGIAKNNKLFTVLFFLVIIGTVAAPLTNGFPGEFLLLKSIFDYQATYAVFAGLTIIFCAVYMLRMFQFSMLGECNAETENKTIPLPQLIPLFVVAFFVISIGFFPQWYMDIFQDSSAGLLNMISNVKGVLS